jgi:hypothetical protein
MFFRAVAFVLALMTGMVLSQVPEFAQQYRQRLGGAIDTLAQIITHFDEDAARSGYDRQGALALMTRNSERLVRDQAGRMRETIERYGRLVEQQQALSNAGPFARIVIFFAELDRPLAENAMRDFEPALPTTLEGVVFAAGGFIVVFLFLHGLRLLFRRPAPSIRRLDVHHHHHHHGANPPPAPSD